MIAALTDHRDMDLLEASLLKTVDELVAPDWALIYHIGNDDVPELSTSLYDGKISQTEVSEPFSRLFSTKDVTSFPIMSHARKVLGYLLVHRAPQLTRDEQALMTDLFRVYDNYMAVLRDSQIDRLTGLLNRRTFDDQLDRALGLIRRAYLEKASDKSNRKVGEGDGCFFMGEEFVVIVYVDDRDDAEMTFERLRRSIENQVFPQVGKVTVSVGITEIKDTSIPVELLGRADQALYYAKTHGRNQVCFYETLVACHQIPVPCAANDVNPCNASEG
jgi:GGDEF domain-containing protein